MKKLRYYVNINKNIKKVSKILIFYNVRYSVPGAVGNGDLTQILSYSDLNVSALTFRSEMIYSIYIYM